MQNHSTELEYARRARRAEDHLWQVATMVRQNIETLERAVQALSIGLDETQIPQLGDSLAGDRCNYAENALDCLLGKIRETHSRLAEEACNIDAQLTPEPLAADEVRYGQLLAQVRTAAGVDVGTIAAGLDDEAGNSKGRPVGYVAGVEEGRYRIRLTDIADWVSMCGVTLAAFMELEKGAELDRQEQRWADFLQQSAEVA